MAFKNCFGAVHFARTFLQEKYHFHFQTLSSRYTIISHINLAILPPLLIIKSECVKIIFAHFHVNICQLLHFASIK